MTELTMRFATPADPGFLQEHSLAPDAIVEHRFSRVLSWSRPS